jgi:hypothetical protein
VQDLQRTQAVLDWLQGDGRDTAQLLMNSVPTIGHMAKECNQAADMSKEAAPQPNAPTSNAKMCAVQGLQFRKRFAICLPQ